jgi:CheY-like chemotaxis protein
MRRLTILMVEVEPPEGLSARKLMAEAVKQNVLTAYSAEEGIELLKENKIDVVVVHSQMPDMPGAELVERVRELNPDIPIIGLTPTQEDLGDTTELIDSFNPSELISVLDKYCKRILGYGIRETELQS